MLACGVGVLSVACGRDDASPMEPGAASRFVLVAAGEDHTCGLDEGGRARCWGLNRNGQLGDGTRVDRTAPTEVGDGQLQLRSLVAGISHTCGLSPDGSAFCWGRNVEGQLGDGTRNDRAAPVRVVGGQRFASIAAGGLHTCALATDGAAYCWGSGANGQLGDGSSGLSAGSAAPVKVSGSLRFDSVSAGGLHSCGLTAGGDLYCWGSDSFGALGTSGQETCDDGLGHLIFCSAEPAQVSASPGFTSVSAGVAHTCAIAAGGAAWCWGRNTDGQLGDGSTTPRSTPTRVSGGLALTAITAGNGHSCALTEAGAAYCWGANHRGQLGDGSGSARLSPSGVAGNLRLTEVSAGGAHTCGLARNGLVYCWGQNADGELGVESAPELCLGIPCSLTPLPVELGRGT